MPRISWKLGRVAGIDVFLHPSVFLAFFLFPSDGLIGVAMVVALFASVVLHEFGHALMARRYGIGTEDITLYVIGGVARLQRMPRSSGPEILIALAGPAVNVVIVGALLAVIGVEYRLGFTSIFLINLMIMNLGLALFNLLPIFPMDGGRVLRALLSGWLGRSRATLIAASLGQWIALLGGTACLAMGQWNLVILAAFVYFASKVEQRQVLLEEQSHQNGPYHDETTAPPAGFRWANRGDGVWRLVPTLGSGRERPWV